MTRRGSVLGTVGMRVSACCSAHWRLCSVFVLIHNPNRQVYRPRVLQLLERAGNGYKTLLQPKAVSHHKFLLAVVGWVWSRHPKGAFAFCGIGRSKSPPRGLYFFNSSFPLGKKAMGIISFLCKHKLEHIHSSLGFWGFLDQFSPFHWCPNRLQGQGQVIADSFRFL